MKRLSRGLRTLADCAPIANAKAPDRRMRTAVSRAKRTEDFAAQQSFDRAVAKLVQATRYRPKSRSGLPTKEWRKGEAELEKDRSSSCHSRHRNRVGVIAVVAWITFDEQMHAFPGTATAKKLLNVAAMTRPSEFEPMETEAGTLNDLFFMKYRLEHYDVPPEFSQQRTIGVRVFDDDEASGCTNQSGGKANAVVSVSRAARFEERKAGRIRGLALHRAGRMERCGAGAQRRSFMAAVRGRKKISPLI